MNKSYRDTNKKEFSNSKIMSFIVFKEDKKTK